MKIKAFKFVNSLSYLFEFMLNKKNLIENVLILKVLIFNLIKNKIIQN